MKALFPSRLLMFFSCKDLCISSKIEKSLYDQYAVIQSVDSKMEPKMLKCSWPKLNGALNRHHMMEKKFRVVPIESVTTSLTVVENDFIMKIVPSSHEK